MRILVTGALGFIGSNLVSNLLWRGHKVTGFDNLSNSSLNPTDRIKFESKERWTNFKYYNVDIATQKQVAGSIIINEEIDIIIHLAAIGSVPRSFLNPELYSLNNEVGFANMLYLTNLTTQRKIIYASSSSVYGNVKDEVKQEDNIGMPLSPYALSKLQNELLANIYCKRHKINHIGLRFFNVYGPGQRFDSPYSAAIPKFINNEEVINVNGDGSHTRDFTYVDDVTTAIYSCITTRYENFICNVGSGVGTSIKELAELISDGNKIIKYNPPRPGDVQISIADLTKAKKYLDYSPKYTIKEGILNTKLSYTKVW